MAKKYNCTFTTGCIGAYVPNTGNPLNGIELKDDRGVPPGFRDQAPIQVMPRFGFACDLFGDGKTVIRGGGGIFAQIQRDGFATGMNFIASLPVINLANWDMSLMRNFTLGSEERVLTFRGNYIASSITCSSE